MFLILLSGTNKVVNPIQALMVNRLLCMQFEFVKALWFYDKKNSLTNGMLLWVLIQGIYDGHFFTKKDSSDIFYNFKKQVKISFLQFYN